MLGDHEGELNAALQARQQGPDRLSGILYEVRALAALGRTAEVNQRVDEALTLPAESGWWGTHATVLTAATVELRAHGHPEASLPMAEREIAWLESRPAEETAELSQRERLARAYYRAERWDAARALYEALAAEFPGEVEYQGALGALAARRGERDEALRISGSLVGLAGPYEFGVEAYRRAIIAAVLGDRDEAVRLLREAFAQGLPYGQYLPHADMDLESLWDYRPFQEIVRPKG